MSKLVAFFLLMGALASPGLASEATTRLANGVTQSIKVLESSDLQKSDTLVITGRNGMIWQRAVSEYAVIKPVAHGYFVEVRKPKKIQIIENDGHEISRKVLEWARTESFHFTEVSRVERVRHGARIADFVFRRNKFGTDASFVNAMQADEE